MKKSLFPLVFVVAALLVTAIGLYSALFSDQFGWIKENDTKIDTGINTVWIETPIEIRYQQPPTDWITYQTKTFTVSLPPQYQVESNESQVASCLTEPNCQDFIFNITETVIETPEQMINRYFNRLPERKETHSAVVYENVSISGETGFSVQVIENNDTPRFEGNFSVSHNQKHYSIFYDANNPLHQEIIQTFQWL